MRSWGGGSRFSGLSDLNPPSSEYAAGSERARMMNHRQRQDIWTREGDHGRSSPYFQADYAGISTSRESLSDIDRGRWPVVVQASDPRDLRVYDAARVQKNAGLNAAPPASSRNSSAYAVHAPHERESSGFASRLGIVGQTPSAMDDYNRLLRDILSSDAGSRDQDSLADQLAQELGLCDVKGESDQDRSIREREAYIK